MCKKSKGEQKKTAVIFLLQLNVIETKDSTVSKDAILTSMVEEDSHEPSKISISTFLGPFTSADLLQKEVKDTIVEGLKTIAQSNKKHTYGTINHT